MTEKRANPLEEELQPPSNEGLADAIAMAKAYPGTPDRVPRNRATAEYLSQVLREPITRPLRLDRSGVEPGVDNPSIGRRF